MGLMRGGQIHWRNHIAVAAIALVSGISITGCVSGPDQGAGTVKVSESAVAGQAQVSGSSPQRGLFRIHRLNSKKQLIRQRFTRNSERPGCHDLRRNRNAYRVAQIGFAWCTVYAGDQCEPGTELPAIWRGAKYRLADIEEGEPQIKILPGSNWYLAENENVLINSWRCEYAE